MRIKFDQLCKYDLLKKIKQSGREEGREGVWPSGWSTGALGSNPILNTSWGCSR